MNVRTLVGLINILAFPSQPTGLRAPAVIRFKTAPVAAQLEGGHVLGVTMKSPRQILLSILHITQPLTPRGIGRPGIRVREALAYILSQPRVK
jgi:hypothetical protein